ncbi:ribonucleoside triphosphate reductase [candidate division KSB1 bacterium]|nr:ribonucleoside triphosphate reductase [candidate division KSB1 bacterium]
MDAAYKLFSIIKKRNGRTVPFNSNKITEAIKKAGQASNEFDEETAKILTIRVLNIAHQTAETEDLSVEDIQDIVEDVLLTSPYKKTAKAYILYRDQHSKMREITSSFNVNLVNQYLEKTDWQVKENSNMTFSLQGLNNYISSEISKIYWLNQIYPSYIREAHVNGDVHIHDLGILSVYCVGWDLHDLLLNGFKGATGKLESNPANHFRSALGQIVNFFYTLQGEAAGAQAFSNFDTLLAPFIRYDGLSYREVKQALQEFLFNVNVPTRVGFQTPFTNVTLDLTVPSYFADQPVIIGGKPRQETYRQFSHEQDILNQAFLEVMLEGDAKGRVFTFPIPTYNITKNFDWDNPNIELLWQITAKYGIPYFANFVNSDMDPEDARSMCCRLRIDNRKLDSRGGGLFGSAPLTGSVGVVSVNMPRLGYLSESENEFFDRLSSLMDLAKSSLEIKRKILENFTGENLYPYTKFYLRDVKTRFGQYWKNHFATIGLVGLNEAVLNLKNVSIGTPEGRSFALNVLDFMRNKLVEFQQQTGNNYNLEATPAEGTSYRLAQLDKQKYDIVCANEEKFNDGAAPYYTNSSQLPVNFTDDLFEMLDLQDEIQTKYTGGTVLHLFLGEKIKNINALKKLIRKVCSEYRLPYFSITPTFSVCPDCGYLEGEKEFCPHCGDICEVYSRVVGYLRPVNQWNKGKQEEFKQRKTLNNENWRFL